MAAPVPPKEDDPNDDFDPAFDKNNDNVHDKEENDARAKHAQDDPNDDFDPRFDHNKDGKHDVEENNARGTFKKILDSFLPAPQRPAQPDAAPNSEPNSGPNPAPGS